MQKQGINIPFGQGIDTKTDPKQVAPGKLLSLTNVVFNSQALQKRNGYRRLTNLPSEANSLATFSGGLVALGQTLQAYSAPSNQWLDKGSLPAIDLEVVQVGRTGYSQITSDVAIDTNGLSCVVYQDGSGVYYQFVDINNNDVVLAPVLVSATASRPRVRLLPSYFVITFFDTVAASPHLRYIAIPRGNIESPEPAADISTTVKANPTGYDCIVANGQLYLVWNGSDLGGAVRLTLLTNQLTVSSPVVLAGEEGDICGIVADNSGSTPNIWILFYQTSSTTTKAALYGANLVEILAPMNAIVTTTINKITGTATGGTLTFYAQYNTSYSYDAAIRTDIIYKNTLTSSGTLGTAAIVKRGLGIASKAFTHNGTDYMLGVYGAPTTTLQPSYFLIDAAGNVVLKLAYSNGAGYLTTQTLTDVVSYGDSLYLAYLFRDQLVPVNKTLAITGAANGIYSQNGVNIAKLTFDVPQYTAEIGGALHITGGLLWMYDGSFPVEHGFNVWPENLEVNTSGTGGLITAQQYYYQFCYEWTDARGNIHRSAPSQPVGIVTTGSTSTNTIDVPTLRLTNKENVRLVGYRWSTAQPVMYQFTSITSPTLNNPAVDSLQITDTLADSAILGNTILYTTGGVLENIGAPACAGIALFKSRLLLLSAENRNLIWVSKQVIEATPVELTDLLTIYVAPTLASQNSTGVITALSSMDDKIIIFKNSAAYYVTGQGPDNTGANNDFSDPVFINSTVGCTNPNSIVFSPNGLMFQTNKGIWLLGRDLSTPYIGAAVEDFNDANVLSAISVPSTTQVRFTLDNGITLMYDYYYDQWGTFQNIPGISSTLYQNLHTYLDAQNRILQETPGVYLDGSNPVLFSFTTSWLKLTDLQGFQRVYFFYLLGEYKSPHKLNVQVAFDYNPAAQQSSLISPTNYSPAYGDDPLYGSGNPYGGTGSLEQWRVFTRQQKCQSIQVSVSELYDPSYGVAAGAGVILSGLNFVIGAKKGYPRLSSSKSVG
jgi:hypothetical protein